MSARSLVDFFGSFPVMDLTPGLVERYKLWRLGQCGPTGVNRDLATLRFMLNLAIRLGYIKDNPVSGVKMLAEPQDRMHVLSHDHEKKYLLSKLTPGHYRMAEKYIESLCSNGTYRVSVRRACRVARIAVSTFRYESMQEPRLGTAYHWLPTLGTRSANVQSVGIHFAMVGIETA